jgi:Family of unknown function (DUF5670)
VLGGIATALIVLWFLGLFIFNVTNAYIHVILVVGLILLVLSVIRGSRTNKYSSRGT